MSESANAKAVLFLAFPHIGAYIFPAFYQSPFFQFSRMHMIKLVAMFKKRDDMSDFDKHYKDIHTSLVSKYPGLRKLEITHVTGAPIGDSKFYLMAEMYFDSKDAMDKAMASPEGKAVAKDLMSFAADIVTVFYGEVQQ
jgi:uncharacterized protein (TIGR02118 family)